MSRLIDGMEMKVDSTSNNLQSGMKRLTDFINANAGILIIYKHDAGIYE
jgi:hypothetical protein